MILIKVALDSNVLVYMHESDEPGKQAVAKELVLAGGSICTQVISEYVNVLRRKLNKPKEEILDDVAVTLAFLSVRKVDERTLRTAAQLIRRYDFQIFDGIIVAASLEAGCDTLYSEDMNHGLLVEGRLKIINPFR